MNKCKSVNCNEQLKPNSDICFSCGMIQIEISDKLNKLEQQNMIMTYNDQTLKENQ